MAETDRPDTVEKEESSQNAENAEKKKETTEAAKQEVNIVEAEEKEEEKENDNVEQEKPHIKWVMKYDKPLPQSILKLCLEEECILCRKKFHRLEDCSQHYDSSKHCKKVEQELAIIYVDGPDDPVGFRLSQAPRLLAVRKEEEGRQGKAGGRQEGGGALSLKRKHEEGVEEQGGQERAHRRWTKGYDMPLPQEVLKLCVFDECRLCEVKLSSLAASQQHYDGSKHAKRVRARLEEWARANPGLVKPKKLTSSGLVPTMSSFVLEHAKTPIEVRKEQWDCDSDRLRLERSDGLKKKTWVKPGPNF